MSQSISQTLAGWTREERGDLCLLLELETSSSIDQLLDRVKWLYHSKTRDEMGAFARNLGSRLLSQLSKKSPLNVRFDQVHEVPSYDALILGACKHLKATADGASTEEHERFLIHAIIVAALYRMKPKERQFFFQQPIDVAEFSTKAGIPGPGLIGPATTLALLGSAHASGFGVYLAATTALGFVTHAVGITLPFAAYTGMTSTIAVLTGPAGWLTAGLWGAWKLTQPQWTRLIPALVFIVVTNSKRGIDDNYR